jgi:dsDNA-specific endonuclease/ATPase MutS2
MGFGKNCSESWIFNCEIRRSIQGFAEAIVTQREGRYVVPVRVENKKDIKGIVP